MKILLSILLFLASGGCFAQEIMGTVINNSNKDPLFNAAIILKKDSIIKDSVLTNFDGEYKMLRLAKGIYNIEVSSAGYISQSMYGIDIKTGEKMVLNFKMESVHSLPLPPKRKNNGTVIRYPKTIIAADSTAVKFKKPLVDKYKPGQGLTSEEIKRIPSITYSDPVSMTPGIYKTQRHTQSERRGDEFVIDSVHVDTNLYPPPVDHYLDSTLPIVTYIKDGVTVTANATVAEQRRIMSDGNYDNASFSRMRWNDKYATKQPIAGGVSMITERIEGTVTNAYMQPLAGIAIRALQNGIVKDTCLTDQNGTYKMKGLDAGFCEIIIADTHYLKIMRRVKVMASRSVNINAILLDIILKKPAVPVTPGVVGVVTNTKNEPLAGVSITIKQGGILKAKTTTDVQG